METISGLLTIRAFRWQTAYQDKLFDLLDKSQKPFYLLFMVQRWLSVVLDLVTTAIAILVVGLAVALRSNSGLTGVALVNVMAITETLQLLIMQWSSLETSLGAVSRTEDYAKTTEVESTDENIEPGLRDWPSEGSISFNGVSVRHAPDKPEVLHNITLNIPSGAKVGIFGRSGSGKSSLISPLFGMTEITSGSIIVDGIDISQVSPLRLRGSIIGLPQQDYIIPGLSLRDSIAPTYSNRNGEGEGEQRPDDERIIYTLKLVCLWDKIRSFHPEATSHTDILDMTLSSDNSNDMILSPGQMRLLCLARAILRVRPGSIVVLDEPMSVMDSELRSQIRHLFNRDDGPFGKCTVLMVQHHMDTLLDFDLALFLVNGRISEMGHPRELLNKENGELRSLWTSNAHIEEYI
ncbi:hypothetical protein EIK77_004549 [Talaromyces pinophilus]|nr:hypothetical protein EIK77_004549 [Talaromyces pinophilus]